MSVWQWEKWNGFVESPDRELLDIAQHLMRSEISNSFFASPYHFKDFSELEVKVLTRREINHSREIMTLNFVFGLPMKQMSYGKETTEFTVHCLTIGMRLLPEDLEERFLANQNAFVAHSKKIIDKFAKQFSIIEKVAKQSGKDETQVKNECHESLKEDVAKVMEDIESILCEDNVSTYSGMDPFNPDPYMSPGPLLGAFEKYTDDKSNRMTLFLRQVLFSHFRSSFNTVVVGSNMNKINCMIEFLEVYLLEHEQDCKRYCLTVEHSRIMPFLPLQGIYRRNNSSTGSRKDAIEEPMERLFDRNSPNAHSVFYTNTPPVLVDVDNLSCWYICNLKEWSDICENMRNNNNARQRNPLPAMPFYEQKHEKGVQTHPWFNEHLARLLHIPEKLKRAYMREFRNLMLRKALLLKRVVSERKNRSKGVEIQSVKRLWWMDDHQTQNPFHNSDASLDTELLVGWLEHVCPTLGLYTLRTQPGTAVFEINM
ncbi:uncharacterized protein LOC142336910 isoform X2 [Convolutriloba macropyga]|uniref:uncharacterized protein LOC142336910 isoform X2 n=1 Tax=Convolutriloba macropyga TaxID=536237 RepID=UPI003F51FE57